MTSTPLPCGVHGVVSVVGEVARTSTWETPTRTSDPAGVAAVKLKGISGLRDAEFGEISAAFGPPVATTEPG